MRNLLLTFVIASLAPMRLGVAEQPIAEAAIPPSFADDIVPLLTKVGCNRGACHAAQFGKGGFKLSLFGFSPEDDYRAIVRDKRQRRISLAVPEKSLLLQKATLNIPHGGGRVLRDDSPEYRILLHWIREGCRPPGSELNRPLNLTVTPEAGTYPVGKTVPLRVTATYADGRDRDVTQLARFDSYATSVVDVDRAGTMSVVGRGQGVVMVRFRGQAAVAHVLSPFREPTRLEGFAPNNLIDEHVASLWQRLGLTPSVGCSDTDFLRRAFLDCLGTLPTPEQIERFTASTEPNKRGRLVDELLGLTGDPARDTFGEEWAAYWAMDWGDLLKNNRKKAGDSGMWALHNWLLQSFRDNKPLDQLVRELITAQGSVFENGPVNFIAYGPRPTDLPVVAPATDLAETTVQSFLGIRLQCARCHHHPFEAYSQTDYYGVAAFFTQLESKSTTTFGELGFDATVSIRGTGSIKHPRTGAVVPPRVLHGGNVDASKHLDLRTPLADWVTSPENALFARNIVNRVWAHFLGVGLVEPVDDVRATNPPSNPELLDALAADLIKHNYDLKHLLRRIMNSRVYQRSSLPQPENAAHTRYYTHYNVKRLPAEVLLDAIDFACGTREKFPRVPLGTRAIELPDPNFESYFLDTLGRPQRVVACECERTADPNLAQVLQIANGEVLQRKLSDESGRVAELVRSQRDDASAIKELYLVTFSRVPSDFEVTTASAIVRQSANRRQGLEDVLWALCNSREFLFGH